MSGSRVSYKLSEFAKSLPEVEFKFYCEKIEELKCNDPLVIDLDAGPARPIGLWHEIQNRLKNTWFDVVFHADSDSIFF
jgi:hypothetical protein